MEFFIKNKKLIIAILAFGIVGFLSYKAWEIYKKRKSSEQPPEREPDVVYSRETSTGTIEVLKKGSKGEYVTKLQKLINKTIESFYNPLTPNIQKLAELKSSLKVVPIVEDGDFGTQTEIALKILTGRIETTVTNVINGNL